MAFEENNLSHNVSLGLMEICLRLCFAGSHLFIVFLWTQSNFNCTFSCHVFFELNCFRWSGTPTWCNLYTGSYLNCDSDKNYIWSCISCFSLSLSHVFLHTCIFNLIDRFVRLPSHLFQKIKRYQYLMLFWTFRFRKTQMDNAKLKVGVSLKRILLPKEDKTTHITTATTTQPFIPST